MQASVQGDNIVAAPPTMEEPPGSVGELLLVKVLEALASPLSEGQLWALCHQAVLLTAPQPDSEPTTTVVVPSPNTVVLHPNGALSLVPAEDPCTLAKYLPDHYSKETPTQQWVFALGATLYTAADYGLPEDEEPSLSEELEDLIAQMTDEETVDRCSISHVHELSQAHQSAADAAGLVAELVETASCLGVTPSATTGLVMSKSLGTQETDDTSLHQQLMDGIQQGQMLKKASERALGPLEPYVTPRQKLLAEIEQQPVQLLPVSPKHSPAGLRRGSFGQQHVDEDASVCPSMLDDTGRQNTKQKLTLAAVNLDDILGWDPETQVELGFAAAEAESRSCSEPDMDHRSSLGQESLSEISLDDEINPQGSTLEVEDQSETAQPETASDEPSFIRFHDLCHIRRSLRSAELDNLQIDDPSLFKLLSGGKLCCACRKIKFSLLTRPRLCAVCDRNSCSTCTERRLLPAYLFLEGESPAKGKMVLVCTQCRLSMGGVEA